jgi:DNA-binding response OmpR family regulator
LAKRILIADDQIATRELLAKFATMRGFDVVAVTNGANLMFVAAHE